MPKLKFKRISDTLVEILDYKQPKFKGSIRYAKEWDEWLLDASCSEGWHYTIDELKQIVAFMETL